MKQRITRITCDHCGAADVEGSKTVAGIIVRGADGAGVPDEADLCPTCQKLALDNLLSNLTPDATKKFFAEFKKQQFPRRHRRADGQVEADPTYIPGWHCTPRRKTDPETQPRTVYT